MTAAPPTSLREIFEAHVQFVWRTLRHFGVREADLEDVCQDVFITVHQKFAEFRGESAIQTWIYGICWRKAGNYRRRAHIRREVATDTFSDASPQGGPETVAYRAELRARLRTVLGAVDDDKRDVLVLFELEELPMKQVADVVGIPLKTAYSRLYAARRQAAEAYQQLSLETQDLERTA